eukprot:1192089-Prorocentrum_minimum.AAC.1
MRRVRRSLRMRSLLPRRGQSQKSQTRRWVHTTCFTNEGKASLVSHLFTGTKSTCFIPELFVTMPHHGQPSSCWYRRFQSSG